MQETTSFRKTLSLRVPQGLRLNTFTPAEPRDLNRPQKGSVPGSPPPNRKGSGVWWTSRDAGRPAAGSLACSPGRRQKYMASIKIGSGGSCNASKERGCASFGMNRHEGRLCSGTLTTLVVGALTRRGPPFFGPGESSELSFGKSRDLRVVGLLPRLSRLFTRP